MQQMPTCQYELWQGMKSVFRFACFRSSSGIKHSKFTVGKLVALASYRLLPSPSHAAINTATAEVQVAANIDVQACSMYVHHIYKCVYVLLRWHKSNYLLSYEWARSGSSAVFMPLYAKIIAQLVCFCHRSTGKYIHMSVYVRMWHVSLHHMCATQPQRLRQRCGDASANMEQQQRRTSRDCIERLHTHTPTHTIASAGMHLCRPGGAGSENPIRRSLVNFEYYYGSVWCYLVARMHCHCRTALSVAPSNFAHMRQVHV